MSDPRPPKTVEDSMREQLVVLEWAKRRALAQRDEAVDRLNEMLGAEGPARDFWVGDLVEYAVDPAVGEHYWCRGRVVAIERYEDDHGPREWVFVRWIDADGKPEDDPAKFSSKELRKVGG